MSHTPGEDPSIYPLTGGCACGNIRYSLNTSPLVVHCCQCTSCQRETGTAYGLNAVVEGDEVTLLPSAPSASQLQPTANFPSSMLDDWTPKKSRPGPDHGSDEPVQEIPCPVLIPVPADSGALQYIARCPVCLTPVWSNYSGEPLIKFVRVGSLDSPALLGGPDTYIFMRSKQPFIQIAEDGKPRFDAFYPQKEGVWSPAAMVRREKLLARIMERRKEKALDG
ncbi:hypothetical protein CCHL11_09685 [Colletotrichum chlorophyti]|uniref:CENP-V/GFA domain-containing protein n=1 Tax=Colletotrichum chlorophyti TaxID=708187 RepID=A0A1Q8R9U4_9PEZI|nr:hypothetical protein CCHL11_09685 [Colletotrichum chlorophyti]